MNVTITASLESKTKTKTKTKTHSFGGINMILRGYHIDGLEQKKNCSRKRTKKFVFTMHNISHSLKFETLKSIRYHSHIINYENKI